MRATEKDFQEDYDRGRVTSGLMPRVWLPSVFHLESKKQSHLRHLIPAKFYVRPSRDLAFSTFARSDDRGVVISSVDICRPHHYETGRNTAVSALSPPSPRSLHQTRRR